MTGSAKLVLRKLKHSKNIGKIISDIILLLWDIWEKEKLKLWFVQKLSADKSISFL